MNIVVKILLVLAALLGLGFLVKIIVDRLES